VRSRVRTVASAALLAAPTALAFFGGGFFDKPRLWAGIGVWVGLAVVLLSARQPMPRSRPAVMALVGLGALTAWVALSIAWAPVRDVALDDAQRLALYLGFFVAGLLLLHGRTARAVEPALLAGTVVVMAYALSTRLLPGLVDAEEGLRAGGRLDQPLTYWNAVGAVAAIGLVLAVRVAADRSRGARLRVVSAGASPVLSLALYLTLSRGALAALAAGFLVLLAVARDRRMVDSAALVLLAGGLAAAVVTRFPAVESLNGEAAAREKQGLVMLAVVLMLCAACGAGQRLLVGLERRGARWTSLARARPGVSAAVVASGVAVLALALLGPAAGSEDAPAAAGDRAGAERALPGDRARLQTLETNRLDYWGVAISETASAPVQGIGSGGFATAWLQHRDIDESVQDAHSLPLETLVELGIVGIIFLSLFLAGVASAAVRLVRAGGPGRLGVAGPAAAGTVALVHFNLDWGWEMPAVSLLFLTLAATTIAASEHPPSAGGSTPGAAP
jgi:O-Antigen ligase